MKIFVTGGAGFIGSFLVPRLTDANQTVVVYDNFSVAAHTLPASDAVTVVRGDLFDFDQLLAAMDGCEQVVHLGSPVSSKDSLQDPLTNQMAIVGSTTRVLEAARRCGIKRVVLASSHAVYGDNPRGPLPESAILQYTPKTPHGWNKLGAEYRAKMYDELYDMETVILRLFRVYGPAATDRSVVSKFVRQVVAHTPISIYGDGQQGGDFIHVEDAVTAIQLALATDYPGWQPVNVGTGIRTSILELAELVQRVAETRVPLQFLPGQAWDVRGTSAGTDRMHAIYGFTAQVPLEEGVRQLIQSYRGISE